MIPLYDDNPRAIAPIVTLGLIAVNVLVFLWQQVTPGPEVASFMMIPSVVTGAGPGLIQQGAHVARIPYPPGPAWITIFTSMFMHGSILHIAGNMLYLWIFGDNIESDLGHLKYLIFYLVVGFIAAIAQIMSAPGSQVPTLGASGAIAGVMGGYILLHPRAVVHSLVPLGFFVTILRVPAYIVLGIWFLYQVLLNEMGKLHPGQGGGVAYAAHIGGFLAGLILIKLFGPNTARRPQRDYEYGRG